MSNLEETAIINVQTEHFLDIADRRLLRACHEINVQFIWPQCTSGHSSQEDPIVKNQRRQLLRSLLKNAHNNSRTGI